MTLIETDCTVTHEGKNFTAGGAVVTAGYCIGYPGKDGILNDWHGRKIGTYRVTSERPAIFFGRRSHTGSTFYSMVALVDGKRYRLRGFGEGMIAKGKAI